MGEKIYKPRLLMARALYTMASKAGKYLQPHYGNGVFGNVYLSAGQH